MEKRKPSFEKWTYEKYGPISMTKDQIVMQTADAISVSVVNFLFRKEKQRPDKYIVVCNNYVSSYINDHMAENSIALDAFVPVTMDKAELETFVYLLTNTLKRFYGGQATRDLYAEWAKLIDNAMYFVISTTFPLGEVKLTAGQAEQLTEGLEAVTNG